MVKISLKILFKVYGISIMEHSFYSTCVYEIESMAVFDQIHYNPDIKPSTACPGSSSFYFVTQYNRLCISAENQLEIKFLVG